MTIKPYKINADEKILDDLKMRLKNTRWPSPVEGIGWEYGADYAFLKRLYGYWLNEYDWRKWEAWLNEYPQFTAETDGVEIHFWYIKAKKEEKAFPVMMPHGWPGSAFEFFDTIELITDPAAHGGHFPAMEEPELLMKDLQEFYRSIRSE